MPRHIVYKSIRMVTGLLVLLVITLAGMPSQGIAELSIVPAEDHITDFEARRSLARSLAAMPETRHRAAALYQRLLQENPRNTDLVVEAVDVFMTAGKRSLAAARLDMAQQTHTLNTEQQIAVARLYQALGDAKTADDLLVDVAGKINNRQTVTGYAGVLQARGAFYRAEKVYRDYLTDHPPDKVIQLRLASLLVSMDRFAEAEGIYRQILSGTHHSAHYSNRALTGLIHLKAREKKFQEALSYCQRLEQATDKDGKTRLIKADVLLQKGEWKAAIAHYRRLSSSPNPDLREAALIGWGRAYDKNGMPEKAKKIFSTAADVAPHSREARFLAGMQQSEPDRSFWHAVMTAGAGNPDDLMAWGRLYSRHGHHELAIKFFRAALDAAPGHYAARLEMAETLFFEKQYGAALEQLDDLEAVAPGCYKIWIMRARIKAARGDYENAVAIYKELHARTPADPVPVREMARTAVWAGDMEEALSYYAMLLTPAVDRQLLDAVAPMVKGEDAGGLHPAVAGLQHSVAGGSIWEGYDEICTAQSRLQTVLDPERKRQLQRIMENLLPAFLIQRSAALERDAKQYAWHNRLLHARDAYRTLVQVEPFSREARFDLGQVECRLGLCDRAADRYAALLADGSEHDLANQALKKMRSLHRPALTVGYAGWHESGYGDLAGIRRQQFKMKLEVPVICRMKISAAVQQWHERGDFGDETARADGGTLSFNGPITAWLDAAASWTLKDYTDDLYDDKQLGAGEIRVNVYDYVHLELGFARENLPANTFGLRQGIETDTWRIGARAEPTRRVTLAANLRTIDYSDDNQGVYHDMALGYRIMDFPQRLTIRLIGEYRDTDKDSRFVYSDGRLADIIHPYWSPMDYTAGSAEVEWRHHLSAPHFCGNDRHYYEVRISGGSDSNSNAAGILAAAWHYEFRTRWTLAFNGLVHRSEDWDAEGLWADVSVRF